MNFFDWLGVQLRARRWKRGLRNRLKLRPKMKGRALDLYAATLGLKRWRFGPFAWPLDNRFRAEIMRRMGAPGYGVIKGIRTQ